MLTANPNGCSRTTGRVEPHASRHHRPRRNDQLGFLGPVLHAPSTGPALANYSHALAYEWLAKLAMAPPESIGCCNESCVEDLGWSLAVEGLAGAGVQARRDVVAVGLAQAAEFSLVPRCHGSWGPQK